MSRIAWLSLLLASPGCGERERRPGADGSALDCAEGHHADAGWCVPEACGVGTWGDLAVDGTTIFVDVEAVDGGDGLEATPLRSIQAGLDLAGSRGGGQVAVAAGSYPETLELGGDHAGVRLAGRCRELVTLDASVGDSRTPGIEIAVRTGEVELSGLSVVGARSSGILVESGIVLVGDARLDGGAYIGIEAGGASSMFPAELEVVGTEIEGNVAAGVAALAQSGSIALRGCEIVATRSLEDGTYGEGIHAHSGGRITAEDCEIRSNTRAGAVVFDRGSSISLERCSVVDSRVNPEGELGYGLIVYDGGSLTATDSEVSWNHRAGLVAQGARVEVELQDCSFRENRVVADEVGGLGIAVYDGASLWADGCEVLAHTNWGIEVSGDGVEARLNGCSVNDTSAGTGAHDGIGLEVGAGASVWAESCELRGNMAAGLYTHGLGTTVSLLDTVVEETRSDADDMYGCGLAAQDGARLQLEGCTISGNAGAGVQAFHPGTEITLRDVVVRDSMPVGLDATALGVIAADGASVRIEDSQLIGNIGAGLGTYDFGTEVVILDSSVRDTRPSEVVGGGYGLQVGGGSSLWVQGVDVVDNTAIGLAAFDGGTRVGVRASSITGTGMDFSQGGIVGMGVLVQDGAVLAGDGLWVLDNEGPGLFVSFQGSRLTCSDCSLVGNQFAGAAAMASGLLDLRSTTISETQPSVDLGGGVGVFASEQGPHAAPDLRLEDCSISDNSIAGVYLAGEGSFAIQDSTITGSRALSHGLTSRCGDGVYAADVSAWEQGKGLLLRGNRIEDNQGAGLLLDGAHALLEDNSWSDNDLDVLVQGQDCGASGEGYDEVPELETCPTWSRPTCELIFSLELFVQDLEPARIAAPPAGVLTSVPGSRELLRGVSSSAYGIGSQ